MMGFISNDILVSTLCVHVYSIICTTRVLLSEPVTSESQTATLLLKFRMIHAL